MRTRSLEKTLRQKVMQPPALRIENERNPEALPQYFQVTVNVLEAKKLAWSNHHTANSYVIVVLGKKKQRTGIRRNMKEPYYREHFIFELYSSTREIQKTSLWLGVMEAKCCAPPKLIGEVNIELGAIWAQPLHQVFHKWAQLGLPRDPAAGATGFLKVDVSVIYRGDVQAMPVIVNNDKIEDNLLLSPEFEQQRANYSITIYGAYSLPTGVAGQGDGRYGKPPSTFVRLSFCGLMAKTAVQPRTDHPNYCEQISIVEMFPNMCELIRLEVCSGEGYFNKILASAQLRLSEISHDGENGFLPTFGPSLLHIYGTTAIGSSSTSDIDGPYHRGALLIALKTIVPYWQEEIRTITVEPVTGISPDSLWVVENFCVLCSILEVSMLDRRVTGKFCGIAITIGEIPRNDNGDEDFLAMRNEIRSRKLHYTGSLEVQKTKPAYGYLNLSDPYPVLQLATHLPDFRFRIYRNNMIHGIVADLEISVSDVERKLINQEYNTPDTLIDNLNKAIDDAAGNILKFFDILRYSCVGDSCDDMMRSCCTELDEKQLKLQKDITNKIYQQISSRKFSTYKPYEAYAVDNKITTCSSKSKKGVKIMIAEVKGLIENLSKLIFKSCNGWPDIVVWLLNGGSRVAYSKISAADVIHSVIPEQSGRMCGKLQTIYMQPLKCTKHISTPTTGCTCIAAKVELMLWMGLYRQMGAFESYLPHGHKLGIKEYDIYMKSTRTLMLECRVYVYKAKLNISADYLVPHNPFVRVNILNSVEDTITIQKTASPVWNQMLKICKMVNTTPERLSADPPCVLVEVYDSDLSNNTELIGRFPIQPVIGDTQSYEFAPKLQWYDIYRGETQTGQLLMSVQLIQIPETLLKTTVYSTEEETYYVSAVTDTDMSSDNIQRLPSSILPRSNKYKLDVYWWGLRNLKITKKPRVIIELDDLTVESETINDKRNNCNFPHCLVSQIFETALYESHCPPMTIRLYDSSTFGRTVFLGTKVVRDPKKYLIDCIPKSVRDVSLRSSCIMSDDFFRVTQILYVKKSQSLKSADSMSEKSEKPYSATKKSKWKRLLKKSLDEEECALLPVPMKGKDLDMRGKFGADLVDWWYMFNASQKGGDYEDNLDNGDRITIYNEELELQKEFSRFKDWCYTVKLYNGKKTGLPEHDERLHCGFLKVGIVMYKWPPPDDVIAVGANGVDLNKGYFSNYPANETKKFLTRVYMIKGINLVSKDFTGKSDPYVVISCGDKHLGDRNEYIANSTNPIFGKMYEFRCTLPEDYLFTVSLYDYDSEDELIGSTIIDIEDRVYSKHRARVGLPYKYKTAGPNKWHDILKPSEILEDLCLKNHLQLPQYPDLNTVFLNGVEYKDNDRPSLSYTSNDRKEDICLSLLHNWHTMPVCGHYLVPEHVETRSLFNPEKPGIEQGKVQMWVDIFPMDVYTFIPPPVDITPRKEQDYELRVIVWDVLNLTMDRKEEGKADLYVKAWIGSIDDAQYTDVHYRSETGKGSFNWRMIFQFQYKPTERKLIRKEKGPFTEVEEHSEPVFTAHVLDSEIESTLQDDVTASLVLNLSSMSRGFKNASQCDLKVMMSSKKINLFKVRSVRAWWPLKCTNRNTGYSRNAGSIELELMLLPAEKAVLMPVGLGREPPAPLPFPERQLSPRSSKMKLLENICRYGGVEVLVGIFITALLVTAIFYWKLPTLVYELLLEE